MTPFRWLFDEKYINGFNPATKSVPLLYFLYLCSVPLAKVLAIMRIRPNVITTLSNLVALSALFILATGGDAWLFPWLWLLALFLDMSDGIVARVTGQSSAQGSFYDHMSDQVKVIALFLCVALRYQDQLVWIVAFSVNGIFMFFSVMNQLNSVRRLLLSKGSEAEPLESLGELSETGNTHTKSRGLIKTFFDKNPHLKSFVLGVYASVFVMYGNCMVLLLPMSAGREWAIGSMLFFGFVTMRSLLEVARNTMSVNESLAKCKISWR